MLGKIICLWFFTGMGMPTFLQDTLELDEVEVYSDFLERYAKGQHIHYFDENQLEAFGGQSLGNFLQQNSGLFLRQYGEGMVSSLTMRGTSAGHTAVFWNGLPVNSPSLGQSDFSILPSEAIGSIAVHHGSSAALYGTDAIGGSVHLQSDLKFNRGHQAVIQQGIGSFRKFNNSGNYSYSNDRLAIGTKVYRNVAQNNFRYRDLTKSGNPMVENSNSAVRQYGIIQDFAWNWSANSQISTSLWFNSTNRSIQPLMGSNSTDDQKDENLRWVMDYRYFFRKNSMNFKGGFLQDKMLFNTEDNETSQYFLSLDWERAWSEKLQTKVGGRHTHVHGNLSTYSQKEDRLELYASLTARPTEGLNFSLNLRQAVFDWQRVPFTPSISGKWDMFIFGKNQMSLQGGWSKGYKIPTLNDRFWVPGGNPTLDPEKSKSGELGIGHQYEGERDFRVETKLIYFRMAVENWIIWLPQGNFWTPKNIRNVRNQGMELFTVIRYPMYGWKLDLKLNYALNHAINGTRINDNDRSYGKQLPYTPVHKYHWNWNMQKSNLRLFIGQVFTGERFETTDNESSVTAFHLLNSGINYQWDLFGIPLESGFHIYNLLNEQYQVMRLRAMPGRNFHINLKIKL